MHLICFSQHVYNYHNFFTTNERKLDNDKTYLVECIKNFEEITIDDKSSYIKPISLREMNKTAILVQGKVYKNLGYLFSFSKYHFFINLSNINENEMFPSPSNYIDLFVINENCYIEYEGKAKWLWLMKDINLKNTFIVFWLEYIYNESNEILERRLNSNILKEIELPTHIIQNNKVSNSLNMFMYSEEDYDNEPFIIIISNGYNILYSDYLGEYMSQEHGGNLPAFYNNILKFKQFYNNYEYFDVLGNLLCDRYAETCDDRTVFIRYFNGPISFIANQIKGLDYDSLKEYLQPKLKGIISFRNGEVLVPPFYSDIKDCCINLYDSAQDISEEHFVSIVSQCYMKQNKTTNISGIYVDDELCIPVFYDEIDVLKFNVLKEVGDSCNFVEEKRNSVFIRIKKYKSYGLYYFNGNKIIDAECENIQLVLPIKSNFYFPYKTVNDIVQHASLKKGDKYALVFRDKIITTFEIDKIDRTNAYLEWVRIIIKDKMALFYYDIPTKFYKSIIPLYSPIFGNFKPYDYRRENFVLLVKNDNNETALLSYNEKTIVDYAIQEITVYEGCIKVNSCFYDNKMSLIFDTKSYSEIDERQEFFEKYIAYSNTVEYCFLVISSYGTELYRIEKKNINTTIFRFGDNDIMSVHFNFKEKLFLM